MNLPSYRPIDVGIVRAPLLPSRVFQKLGDQTADPNQLIEAAASHAGVPAHLIREAIRIASPNLHRALGFPERHTLAAIRRYLIRMCTRPTPFGYFAGSALFRWSQTDADANLQLTRALFISTSSNTKALLNEATQSDGLIFLASSCRIIAGRLYCDIESAEFLSTQSLKITAVIKSLLIILDSPKPVHHVTEQLCSAHGQPFDTTAAFLRSLVVRGFLVTDSVDQVLQAKTVDVKQAAAVAGAGPASFITSMPAAGEDAPADYIHSTEMGVAGFLNRRIAERAAALASVLLSVNGLGEMHARSAAYKREFLERYGPDRVVGLIELADSGTGLGLLSEQKLHGGFQVRDKLLIELFARGLRDGGKLTMTDVELAKFEQLCAGGTWPETLDIVVNVLASSQDAICKGAFSIQVAPNPGCIGAGRHASRFHRANFPALASLLGDAIEASRKATPGAIQAELRFVPLKRRLLNVISGIHACDVEITDCPATKRAIHPSNIGIAIREGQFQIVHTRSGREIRVHATHMVNPQLAPRLYRALLEFSTANFRRVRRFDWGTLSDSPMLPEIRYSDMILSQAQWNPLKEELRDRAGVGAWRMRWDVPNMLLIGVDDNRLLLDLSNQADIFELIRLARNGAERLHVEASPHLEELSWLQTPLGHHMAEVVVSVKHEHALGDAAPCVRRAIAPSKLTQFLPGSKWLYFQLACPKAVEERVLLEVIAPFVAASGDLCDRWFYIRYTYPDTHIRLRLRSRSKACTELFDRASARLGEAVHLSLCTSIRLDTFTPEVERYGGDQLYDYAERLFEADSFYSLKLLAASSGREPDDRKLLAIRVCHDLMACCELPLDVCKMVAALGGEKTKVGGQSYRRLKLNLERVLTSRPIFPECEALLLERRCAITSIVAGTAFQCYLQTRLETVRDLLHMLFNRFLGIDRSDERTHFELMARTYDSLLNRV